MAMRIITRDSISQPHDFFERDGQDLHCVIPISFPQAALGAEIKIPAIDGEVTIKVPEGTQNGKQLRVRGKGIPHLNENGRGDLIVDRMNFWKDLVKQGLKTPVEEPGNTRSDCHAWGASPNIEFFRNVLGVDSAGPGFSRNHFRRQTRQGTPRAAI